MKIQYGDFNVENGTNFSNKDGGDSSEEDKEDFSKEDRRDRQSRLWGYREEDYENLSEEDDGDDGREDERILAKKIITMFVKEDNDDVSEENDGGFSSLTKYEGYTTHCYKKTEGQKLKCFKFLESLHCYFLFDTACIFS